MYPCIDTITRPPHPATTPAPRAAAAAAIRPLRAGEEHLVLQVFEGLSHDARFMRFHVPTPRLTRGALRAMAKVEEGARGAVVALLDGRAIGLAQWARDPLYAARAELAVAVVDAQQGAGLGRRLVAHLAEVAADQGIVEMVCLVHPENARVRAMLHQRGARRDPDGALVVPVAALNGEAARTAPVLPWTDAVPGPRTPAGGTGRRR